MGWLEEQAAGGPGLWAMNDAGSSPPQAAPGTGRVSWFQVEAGAVAGERPLPVQQFLRCAQDVTARIGTLRLSAVQVLLPVQGIDPAARTPVDLLIGSGRDPLIPAVARQLALDLRDLEQDVFACGDDDVTVHGMTLRGELAEWSCDAVGWLAATVADCAARLGVRSPLPLTVTAQSPAGGL